MTKNTLQTNFKYKNFDHNKAREVTCSDEYFDSMVFRNLDSKCTNSTGSSMYLSNMPYKYESILWDMQW